MRENRLSGSEGGEGERPSRPLSQVGAEPSKNQRIYVFKHPPSPACAPDEFRNAVLLSKPFNDSELLTAVHQ